MTTFSYIPSDADNLSPESERTILQERRQKLQRWRDGEIAGSPKDYPNDMLPQHQAQTLHEQYDEMDREGLAQKNVQASLAGRVMLKRMMGKASFATLQDATGRLQLYISDKDTGGDSHQAFCTFDLGDMMGVEGTLFKTKTGELSLRCQSVRLLSKCLRPLPEKFHGLTDIETRYRQRYLDLMMNPEAKERFRQRSRIIHTIRKLMIAADYLEVETPMMHAIPGGATARPFATHHNALDRELFLRVAPELYLKRLVVGGFERVFEINRNFRNEGISPRHNPEFTMMEFYIAYRDYRYMMDFVEQLLRDTAQQVFASMQFVWNQDTIDLAKPFARLTLAEAMHHYHPEWSMENLADLDFLAHQLVAWGVESPPRSLGECQLMLYEQSTEERVIQPTFIVDYPIEVSPLARVSNTQPGLTERFELFIGGREIANGFSELNDPEDQAARFRAQRDKKNAGDHEAMYYDADYIAALEYGLPPTVGCGIGIDRLVMMFTNAASIRDVILFPTLKSLPSSSG